jgi:hypothetical protein
VKRDPSSAIDADPDFANPEAVDGVAKRHNIRTARHVENSRGLDGREDLIRLCFTRSFNVVDPQVGYDFGEMLMEV